MNDDEELRLLRRIEGLIAENQKLRGRLIAENQKLRGALTELAEEAVWMAAWAGLLAGRAGKLIELIEAAPTADATTQETKP